MSPVAATVLVGPRSCPVTSCKTAIITKVDKKVSMNTHFMAFCLCVRACGLLSMWMPYCIDSCRNKPCPNCETYLGTYRRCSKGVPQRTGKKPQPHYSHVTTRGTCETSLTARKTER